MTTTIRAFLSASALALAIPFAVQAAPESNPPKDPSHCVGMKHGRDHGEMLKKRGERMFDKIGLSEQQRVQARAIMEKHHEKVKAERQAMMNEMDAILTPEQKEKAKALRDQRPPRG